MATRRAPGLCGTLRGSPPPAPHLGCPRCRGEAQGVRRSHLDPSLRNPGRPLHRCVLWGGAPPAVA